MLLTTNHRSSVVNGAGRVTGAICDFCVHLRPRTLPSSSAPQTPGEMPGQAGMAARLARSNSFMNATRDSIAARGQAL